MPSDCSQKKIKPFQLNIQIRGDFQNTELISVEPLQISLYINSTENLQKIYNNR